MQVVIVQDPEVPSLREALGQTQAGDNRPKEKRFIFDHAFDGDSSNAQVYRGTVQVSHCLSWTHIAGHIAGHIAELQACWGEGVGTRRETQAGDECKKKRFSIDASNVQVYWGTVQVSRCTGKGSASCLHRSSET